MTNKLNLTISDPERGILAYSYTDDLGVVQIDFEGRTITARVSNFSDEATKIRKALVEGKTLKEYEEENPKDV